MAQALEGGPVARDILAGVRDGIRTLVTQHGSVPGLAVLKVGDDPSSASYARAIRRTARSVDLPFKIVSLPESTGVDDFDRTVIQLNVDPAVAGIMVLQPLPPHLPKNRPSEMVNPEKDVDGMTLLNVGRLEAGSACLVPSTPQGGVEILRHYDIPVEGRNVVVVGRSLVVGKPLGSMLLAQNATVTICHSHTEDLRMYTRLADIVGLAAGRAGLLTSDMIRPGAVVLDFGVNVHDGEMVGDADPSITDVAAAYTPVPGGTGVVTNAVLMRNTLAAIRNVLHENAAKV